MNPESKSLALLWEVILKRNPRHRNFLEVSLAGLSDGEIEELENLVEWAKKSGFTLERVAEGYTTLVMDTMKEQFFFNKHGRYRYSKFEDVAAKVYHDPDYMERYMLGLALSSYLWPNHAAMRRHFEQHLPDSGGGTYLEIGPGHGFYMKRALQSGGFQRYLGIDLSATSIALTRSVLEHFCPEEASMVELREANFLVDDFEGPVTGVVMGEVLEHVEEPELFLARIRKLVAPNAFIHITTCLNSPAVDHIKLFKTHQEVETMFEEQGLEIKDSLIMPYVGTTLEESEKKQLSINVSYLLTPAKT